MVASMSSTSQPAMVNGCGVNAPTGVMRTLVPKASTTRAKGLSSMTRQLQRRHVERARHRDIGDRDEPDERRSSEHGAECRNAVRRGLGQQAVPPVLTSAQTGRGGEKAAADVA